MKDTRRYILIILAFVLAIPSIAQDEKEAKEWLKTANKLFDIRQFEAAIPYYTDAIGEMPGNQEIILKLGICYLYKPDEHEKAYEYLEAAKEQNPEIPGIDFYLGKAYFYSYQFDDAIQHFNSYRNTVDVENTDELTVVDNYLASCEKAKELYENPVDAVINSVGNDVNTIDNEYAPLITADGEKLVYTYRGYKSMGGKIPYLNTKAVSAKTPGMYREDIYTASRSQGKFINAESISESINTEGNDASIALSADGQKLYLFKSTEDNAGDIYVSKLNGTEWSTPTPLEGDVNTNYWEGSCALSPDGQYLYFASERPGGEGGKDLYRAKSFPDSASSPDTEFWGEVENLGMQINTRFEEDAPFIHPNGEILIFSSTGHPGMGGYDVFRAENKNRSWINPTNVGYPVNTTGDDLYYVLTADSQEGYYSSYRKDGKGKQDIYRVKPGLPGVTPMILLSGTVTLDEDPAGAEIAVIYGETKFGDFEANSASGEYSVPLGAGEIYTLKYTVTGCDECKSIEKTVDAEGLEEYKEDSINVAFYTQAYLDQKRQDSLANIPQDTTTNDGGDDSGDDLGMEHTSAQEYVDEFGNAPPPGYYIIIGSFRNQVNAETLKERMITEEGVDSAKIMLYEKINFYRVVHSYSPDDPEPLRQEYLELQAGEFPRVWILHLE